MTGPPEENERVTLARIEFKLDQAIRSDADHETRLRALESSRWPLPALAGLMSVGAIIISLFR